MTLATLLDAELAFGLQPLLDRAGLTVLEGDRIGLIGRNGTGKSSLLNVIAGRVTLDEGELKRRDGLSIALVEQEPVIPVTSTLRESLALRGGLERLTDERERWRIEARLVEYLHRFGLDEAKDPAQLSGGETKRGALALAFAQSPDLLLLDEPTNHLDIDGITLLEDLLLKAPALIVITHDRAFLREQRPAAFVPGPIEDTGGRVVGTHTGLPDYTIGQRKGLQMAVGEPLYVVALDAARNALVVGRKHEVWQPAAMVFPSPHPFGQASWKSAATAHCVPASPRI